MYPNIQEPILVKPQSDVPTSNPPTPGLPVQPESVAQYQPQPQPQPQQPFSSFPDQSYQQPRLGMQSSQPLQSVQPPTPQANTPDPSSFFQPDTSYGSSVASPTSKHASSSTTPYPVNPINPYVSAPLNQKNSQVGQNNYGSQMPASPGSMSSSMPPQPSNNAQFSQSGQPPVTGGQMPPAFDMSPSKKKSSTKKLLLIFGILFLLVATAVAYFSFIYFPNTPKNVWNTGLNRSGTALQTLSTQATEKETLETFSKSKVTATMSGKADGIDFTGSLDSQFDKLKSSSELKFKADVDSKNVDLGLKLLTDLQEGKQYPDIYFQFYGLKALGFDALFPEVAKYESKWIAVDSDYIQSNLPTEASVPGDKEQQQQQITAAEVAEIANVVSDVSDEYVFTTDEAKAVLELIEFVAKETVEGKKTYHYKVNFNTEHTKDYCKTIVEQVTELPSVKRIAGESASSQKTSALDDCAKISDLDDEFDLWIDAKYKLIYKVRFTDPDESGTYADIGQDYTGTDDITIFVNYKSEKNKSEVQTNITTNLQTKKTKAKMSVGSTAKDSAYDFKLEVNVEPYDGDIDVAKPEGTVTVQEVLQAIGLDPKNPASL
ncbi:hypothetical protein KC946_01000 [Candidatus Saccharibacteria bacterium]|nr:hypothetical protein [Candidatus Saccharibacteria bacterium]